MPLEGARYLNCPLFKESTLGMTREAMNNQVAALLKMPYLGKVYKRMLTDEYSMSMIRKVLLEVINSDAYPVMFHCTAGKDRTGVIAFLLLYMLEVDYETIIDDYLETNQYYIEKADNIYKEILSLSNDPELALKLKGFWMVTRDYLEDGLSEVIRIYGSIDSYIRNGLQIDDETIACYRNKFLTDQL